MAELSWKLESGSWSEKDRLSTSPIQRTGNQLELQLELVADQQSRFGQAWEDPLDFLRRKSTSPQLLRMGT